MRNFSLNRFNCLHTQKFRKLEKYRKLNCKECNRSDLLFLMTFLIFKSANVLTTNFRIYRVAIGMIVLTTFHRLLYAFLFFPCLTDINLFPFFSPRSFSDYENLFLAIIFKSKNTFLKMTCFMIYLYYYKYVTIITIA